jgi:hypothetical protein
MIGSGGGIQAALAQDAAAVTVDVGDCVKLQAPEERLACYERHVDAARKNSAAPAGAPAEARPATPPPAALAAPSAASVAPAAAAPSAAPAPSAASESATASVAPAPPKSDSGSTGLAKIDATVTAVKVMVPNELLITLDNGQVWRQNRAQWFPLQPGQRVTLSQTKWGASYRLTADGLRGFIQVERAR